MDATSPTGGEQESPQKRFDEQGGPRGDVGAVWDITERRRIEETLRRTVERLELLSQITADLQGSERPQELAQAVCRKVMTHLGCHAFFNYLVDEREQRLRLHAYAGIPAETARQIEWLDYEPAMCGCLHRGDAHDPLAGTTAVTCGDRAELAQSFGLRAYACHPLRTQGRVIGNLSFGSSSKSAFSEDELTMMRVVTDQVAVAMQRVQLMESLRERAAEAQAASVAKSQFLANMSHELRTPMNAVLGMTDLALREPLTPTVREYLQTARQSAAALLELLNQILDFSRIEAGALELEATPYRLRQTVDQVIKTLGVVADEKGLELICEVSPDVPEQLIGDPLRLRQILVNLIGNAIKFTARGEVVVRAELASLDADEVNLRFTVADTGIGISPADQERIFSPFTQADPSTTRHFGGSGLGLAITCSLVRLMGGRLWLESQPGHGSQFHFTVRSLLQPESAGTAPAELPGQQVLAGPAGPVDRRKCQPLARCWNRRSSVGACARKPPAMRRRRSSRFTKRRRPTTVSVWSWPTPACRTSMVVRSRTGYISNRDSPDPLFSWSLRPNSGARRGTVRNSGPSAWKNRFPSPNSSTPSSGALGLESQLGRAAKEGEPPPVLPAPSRPLRVLLAEDTPANQQLIIYLLSRRGHHVEIAHNGREAVDLAGTQHFDVLLMDVQMPVMDGLQATAAIRASSRPAAGGCRLWRSPPTRSRATRNASWRRAWTATSANRSRRTN